MLLSKKKLRKAKNPAPKPKSIISSSQIAREINSRKKPQNSCGGTTNNLQT
jgi:hypothetical protein